MIPYIIAFLLGVQTTGMIAVLMLYWGLGTYNQTRWRMLVDALLWPMFLWILFQKE